MSAAGRRPRVAVLLHELARTGAPRVALDVVAASGDQVDWRVVAPKPGPLLGDARAACRTDVLRTPRGLLGRPVVRGPVVRAGLRRWRPDVLYVNSVAALPYLDQLGPMPGVPVLLHVHELDAMLDEYLARHRRKLDGRRVRYVAVSGASAEALWCRGVAAGDVTVVHAFLSDERVNRLAGLRREDDAGRPFVVGTTARVSWRKGPELWARLTRELEQRFADRPVRAEWVGLLPHDGLSEGLRQMTRKLGSPAVAELIESVPDVADRLAGFDAFVLTSVEDPCPLSLLEAMAVGLPCVYFTGSGGAAEQAGDAGVAIDDFDPAAMADALADLAADPERRRQLGEAAQRRVREGFMASVQVPKILAEVRRLAGARP